MNAPRILVIDIETTPNLANVWSLWNQNVSLGQLRESTALLCYAYKWLDDDVVHIRRNKRGTIRDQSKMVTHIWSVLDQADIVVTYNGKRFDIPHLNREFITMGLTPPSPYKQVDLYEQVKKHFRFPSNKLAYVVKTLGLSQKFQNSGFDLWLKCQAGDEEAWAEMIEYNTQDVLITEQLYYRLRPWIANHPTMGLYVDLAKPVCSRCGSTEMQKRGSAYTALTSYQRYRCNGCGGWSRGGQRINSVGTRGI